MQSSHSIDLYSETRGRVFTRDDMFVVIKTPRDFPLAHPFHHFLCVSSMSTQLFVKSLLFTGQNSVRSVMNEGLLVDNVHA